MNTVHLNDDELKGRIIGKEGRNIKTLELLLGVDIIIDETPNAIIPPTRAPHRPAVRDMPPQNPVAMAGIISDLMLCFSATAERTVSAQYKPDSNNSLLRSTTVVILCSYPGRA